MYEHFKDNSELKFTVVQLAGGVSLNETTIVMYGDDMPVLEHGTVVEIQHIAA